MDFFLIDWIFSHFIGTVYMIVHENTSGSVFSALAKQARSMYN